MIDFTVFQGRRDQFRSQKKQHKPVVKKVDNLDQATKDQKEYLGQELFGILKEYEAAVERGEIMEDGTNHEESVDQPKIMGLGALAKMTNQVVDGAAAAMKEHQKEAEEGHERSP